MQNNSYSLCKYFILSRVLFSVTYEFIRSIVSFNMESRIKSIIVLLWKPTKPNFKSFKKVEVSPSKVNKKIVIKVLDVEYLEHCRSRRPLHVFEVPLTEYCFFPKKRCITLESIQNRSFFICLSHPWHNHW